VWACRERRELTELLSRLVELDPNEHYLELGSAIVRADAIKVRSGTPVALPHHQAP
jgi:hypothetical protein